MKKRTLSVIILTKNEESMIADCLSSVSFADEIVVVDNYSTDSTVEIAKKQHAKVISTNAASFSIRREIGLQKAGNTYIFYLDADERVSPELKIEIQDFLSSAKDTDAYIIKRQNYYLGKNPWPKIEHFPRFFKRTSLKGWRGDLHESPIFNGTQGEFSGYIEHFTHRNFSSMVAKTNEWSGVEAKLRFDASHPKMSWWRFPRVMLGAFYESFVTAQGFKAGKVGFMESVYQSFSMFITYAKLWELQVNQANAAKSTHKREKLLQ